MTSAEIRQTFLDFFKSKQHEIVSSAPIVIKNDPTLMFTNAGMNQFKDFFLGNKQAPYKRVADTQKCLRVSGKHNDLEEVGVDTYHHTMFEMLGNWSFGDYFKKEAIEWSWELLTDVYKIDKDRLYVTIFEGDSNEGLPKDDEALNEWKKWINEDRILSGNKKDNFWEMGDTGPCGPCTEIHYDGRSDEERKAVDGKSLVNNDDPQVIEIWNVVFIQFERYWNPQFGGINELRQFEKDNSKLRSSVVKEYHELFKQLRYVKHLELTLLEELFSKHVDTGMGFERLVRVLQDKKSNYDTDVFTGTIAEMEKIVGKNYISDPSSLNKLDLKNMDFDKDPDNFKRKIDINIQKSIELKLIQKQKESVAFRVLSDHIRAICFTIADGQLPSNTGPGYVIRRILRRAVRYYYSYLDYKQPLLFQLVNIISKQFENVFPELNAQLDFVIRVVKEEEESFLRTLGNGLNRINQLINYISEINRFDDMPEGDDSRLNRDYAEWLNRQPSIRKLSGKDTFELYDTYGFPLDLTELVASERGFSIDEIGFETEMQQQKQRSRAATTIDTEDWVMLSNDDGGVSGIELIDENSGKVIPIKTTDTYIVKYRKVKQKDLSIYQIVLGDTNFYAESGGQVGDSGVLLLDKKNIVEIFDTKKENGLVVHFTKAIPDDINKNTEVLAHYDIERRKRIAVHHSATHLLHAALRKVLSTHVQQKGSLVNAEHLRFDFSHFAKMTDEEITKVEAMVNEKIRENIPVVIKQLPKEEALKLGAMALFGEKYGDIVRVVIIDPTYSVELCGGTHVGATGELGFFKIKTETAVAAGVRRIEAVSGKSAEELIQQQFQQMHFIRETLKNPKDIFKSIENLNGENTDLKKQLESAEAKQINNVEQTLLKKLQTINEVNFIGEIVEIGNVDSLKKLRLSLGKKINGAVVLCACINGKAEVPIAFSDELVAKGLDANKIIQEKIKILINGGGGGSKTMAAAGGKDCSKFKEVIEVVKGLL